MYLHPVQIIIVLTLVVAGLIARNLLLSAKRRKAERHPLADPELASVSERVKVLERIVTDRNHSLALEIDELRHR